jgi:two-component system phosphate regulon sensor histidine kinase PhoR
VPPEQLLLLLGAALAAVGGAALLLARRERLRRGPVPTINAATTRPPAGDDADSGSEVLDMLDLGIVRLDAERRVLSANPAAARLLGQDSRALARRSLLELFLDHRVDDAARDTPARGSITLEVALRDGVARQLAVRIERGQGGGTWLLIDDVTELRRLQRIRSEFIDNLAHELRTPLTTIRLLTEKLGDDLTRIEVPPRIRERVSTIDVETGHLVQMVNELLDLSRIESGTAELHLERVDMVEVIDAALDRLRTFAERQGVRLSAELPDGGVAAVRGDAERLGQLLINLLHNAVKFSPADSVVTVAADERDGQLAVAVSDHGTGIARDDLDRVFERFYKGDKARQRGPGGTGLGLAIARHIAEGHGGRIWVESEEGRGSTFTFTVPLAE